MKLLTHIKRTGFSLQNNLHPFLKQLPFTKTTHRGFRNQHIKRKKSKILSILIGGLLFFSSANGQEMNLTVTAYCSCYKCCGKWAQFGKTASGRLPTQGVTCAAPRRFPFGTKLHIEGVGYRVVQDRLAPKFDNRVDIYFRSHSDALKFGKRTLKVVIVSH